MSRSIFQVRILVAMLMLSLALGIGSAIAAPPPCFEQSVPRLADYAVADASGEIGRPCNDRGCTTDPLGCCSAMLSQSCCGLGALAQLTVTPLAPAAVVRPSWALTPTNTPTGLDPRVDRRPPRASA